MRSSFHFATISFAALIIIRSLENIIFFEVSARWSSNRLKIFARYDNEPSWVSRVWVVRWDVSARTHTCGTDKLNDRWKWNSFGIFCKKKKKSAGEYKFSSNTKFCRFLSVILPGFYLWRAASTKSCGPFWLGSALPFSRRRRARRPAVSKRFDSKDRKKCSRHRVGQLGSDFRPRARQAPGTRTFDSWTYSALGTRYSKVVTFSFINETRLSNGRQSVASLFPFQREWCASKV